ncbi:MAG: 23S rRNA (adenine(2503)-C(2))-methyltransferase RlmN [Parvularculaceae bacterium]
MINIAGATRGGRARARRSFRPNREAGAHAHATQIWRWVYHYGHTDFERMTDIGKEMRTALAEKFVIARPEIVERQVSVDGTRKYLLRMGPGVEVECVYIPDVGRSGALCVSSQVGCTLNCTFCHTGTQSSCAISPRPRLSARCSPSKTISRNGPRAATTASSPTSSSWAWASRFIISIMSRRRSTSSPMATAFDFAPAHYGFSTSGVVPEIPRLGEMTAAMLAISLHATNDPLRDELVPINRKYPIAELLEACRKYPDLGNARRITFEYVMLKGVNDSDAEARELVRLLKGIPAKINLIPFNPWPGAPYECADWTRIEAFADIVNRAGYASPIRTPRGRDILAACGQLKSESVKKRASELRKEATV